jgi:PAS domain S-box-containing protein
VPVAQRVVLDHLQDGVIVLDPHSRIVDLNPAARQMLDLGPGEMVGLPAGEVVKPAEVLALCPAPGQGEPDAVAETLVALGEGQRWLRVSALPLMTQGGRAEGHILIFRDVSREQTAEQLRQDLTHITVHDLRNPLNVVEAALAMLADSGSQEIDASLQGYLRLAQSSCRRATELVTAILEVSQLESGQVPLDRQPLDVAGLVSDVCQGMGLLAAEGQLTLALELADDVPPIRADATLLRRVLENLVSNAIKFTPPGGTVTAAVRRERAGLHLVVADTGPGLAPEMEGRLFQKFCPGPEDGRGTGLGLAFCKLAVEAHGGRIWIESNSGQGVQAHVTIPSRGTRSGRHNRG